MQNFPLKKALPHLAAVGIFVLISCAFFYPQLEGRRILQTDIASYQGMAHELIEHKKETGKVALWTNSMFSGMPAYQIFTGYGLNALRHVESLTQLFINRPIGYFIGAMVGFYIMFIILGVNPWLSIIGAVAFALSTNNLVLFEAGHTSKLRSLFLAAPMFAGVVIAFRKKYLLGGAVFAAALGINLYVNHFQITYYLLLFLGVYGLIALVETIRDKDYQHFLKAVGVLAVATVLAVASSASKIMTTMEYARDTMRGEPILEKNEASDMSSSETEGLAWDYAMRWSNGIPDLLASLVPRAAGGSGQERTGEDSELYKNFYNRGVRLSGDFREPLYWGALPFTSGPAYFGAVVIFLFVLGLMLVQKKIKWWILIIVVLTMLMSMGKNLEWFNRLLFDYLPYYNKFRAPSSILTITALFVPILAFLGLQKVFRNEHSSEKVMRALYVSLGVVGGICAFLALGGPSLFDFTSPNDANYANVGYPVDAIVADRKHFFSADAWRSFIFILAAAASLFAYKRGWISKQITFGLIGLLTLIDLWGVGRRYITEDAFVTQDQYENLFKPDAADLEILRDQDLHYRVHDVSTDPWNSSAASYHHRTIGGYHAAKLQRYQDMIDYYLAEGNQSILNMLNAKYFILPDQDGGRRVQRNPQAFGNAWFVEGIERVESADEEISVLEILDLKSMAVIHKDFHHLVEGFDPTKNGSITLTEYAPDRLVYRTNARTDQLAVFSEVWYGPDKGWKAYLDGQPVDLMRANYILRAMNVPEGEHTIEMVFKPRKYYIGETLSLVFSILIILALIAVLALEWRKADWATTETPEPASKPKKKGPARKTRKK